MESDMNEKKKNGNSIAAGFFLLLLLTAADQLTKYLAASTLKGTSGISLIPHVFELFIWKTAALHLEFLPIASGFLS